MIDNKRVLALIPARGGSKRLPGKNIAILGNKPLIAWSIDAAKESQYVDHVIVSTDDEEIARVSRECGAHIPFLRPACLAEDTSTSNDVILHALNELTDQFDIVILLQPTSPLRTAMQIDSAIEVLEGEDVDGVVSVCECEHSPLWSNVLPEGGNMGGFIRPEVLGKRSQDLPKFYRLNGAIYAYKCSSLIANGGIHYSDAVYAYKMPQESSVDIDTHHDFKIASSLIRKS